eukprot:3758752-Pyramimonas_sp.AAC.1
MPTMYKYILLEVPKRFKLQSSVFSTPDDPRVREPRGAWTSEFLTEGLDCGLPDLCMCGRPNEMYAFRCQYR